MILLLFLTAFTEESKAVASVSEVNCEEVVLEVSSEKGVYKGQVSYYGKRWDGRTTANMEIYNSGLLTCASPTLPFNTIIEVTNMDTCEVIIVRVNDRGPYKMDLKGRALRPLQAHPKRVLDLSRAAFDSIGNLDKGLLNVEYRVVGIE